MSLPDEVLGALVGAVVTLLVAWLGAIYQRNSVREERKYKSSEELDLLREPLLVAAENLSHRIKNIQRENFSFYLHGSDDYRREIARLGTLYRFANYWAIQELLYRRANLLRFEQDSATRNASSRLNEVVGRMATDRKEKLAAIVWKDEQRAIGELMIREGINSGEVNILTFVEFIDVYEEKFLCWMGHLSTAINQPDIIHNKRLREVSNLLDELVVELRNGRIDR